MAGPGDQTTAAAADRGHLRASRASRREAADVLTAAFVQGWLAKDEFGARIGQARAARTYAELAAVTADVPAGLDGVPPRRPLRELNVVRWGASGLVTPAVVAAAIGLGSLRGDAPYRAAALVIALVYVVFWLSVGAGLLWEWHCMSLPAAQACVRCAYTAASHRPSASCAVRLGSVWRRCPCAGYVLPGLSPQAAGPGRRSARR
jgi:Domain of unknown function (DUF1707)